MTVCFYKLTKNNSSKVVCYFRLTAVLLIISLFSAILFEVIHIGHEDHCHEEECPVCFALQIIHYTNKISFIVPAITVGFIVFCFINIFVFSDLLLVPATLVSQKIKLVI